MKFGELLGALCLLGIIGLIIYAVATDGPRKPSKPVPSVGRDLQQAETNGRFVVRSQGSFEAGYCNNKREILIITDTVTGEEYLTITGCGTTEVRSQKRGKTTVKVEE